MEYVNKTKNKCNPNKCELANHIIIYDQSCNQRKRKVSKASDRILQTLSSTMWALTKRLGNCGSAG